MLGANNNSLAKTRYAASSWQSLRFRILVAVFNGIGYLMGSWFLSEVFVVALQSRVTLASKAASWKS